MELVRPNLWALINNSLELLFSFGILGINTAKLLAVELQRNYPLQTMLASHRKRVEKYGVFKEFPEWRSSLDTSLINKYAKRLWNQETDIRSKLRAWFAYRREQLTDIRRWQEWIANYYENPILQEEMLTIASEWYHIMQQECPDRLEEYMLWLWLNTKEAYLERFYSQLQSLPGILCDPHRLIAKRNYHRRKRDSWRNFDYELMTNTIGWHAWVNQNGIVEARVDSNKSFVESYAVHEMEHVVQEILTGNDTREESTEAAFGYSPYYYWISKQDFGINTVYLPFHPISKRYTPLNKFLWRMWEKITDLNKGISQQQKSYVLNLQEILARIQEIRMYLSKNSIILDVSVLTWWDVLSDANFSSETIRKNKYDYAVARARNELSPYVSNREQFIRFVAQSLV